MDNLGRHKIRGAAQGASFSLVNPLPLVCSRHHMVNRSGKCNSQWTCHRATQSNPSPEIGQAQLSIVGLILLHFAEAESHGIKTESRKQKGEIRVNHRGAKGTEKETQMPEKNTKEKRPEPEATRKQILPRKGANNPARPRRNQK